MKKTIITTLILSAALCFTVYTNGQTSVIIGEQEWTSKNLDVSTYRNGDPIPQVTDPKKWANLTTGAWCYYKNDPENGKKYGKMYNWYAVNDPRGLAPKGWHIPTDAEWTVLYDYLGFTFVAGGKSTTGWKDEGNGMNSSGFNGLPGGYRYYNGLFYAVGSDGRWWSASENNTTDAWYRFRYYDNGLTGRSNDSKKNGISVRCVRD